MTILIIGIIVFFALHFVPSFPGIKQGLVDRMGLMGYRGFFSVLSTAGLALIVWGYWQSEFTPVYEPSPNARYITMACVLLAFVCLASANMQNHIRKALKHPMLVGIGLWALGHLIANGDLASIILFGAFLIYAVIDILAANAQGRVKVVEPKLTHDVIAIIAGLALYAVVLYLHPIVIGVAII